MGNILGLATDQLDDPHSTPQLKITLDLDRPVYTEIKQLLHWSLAQIRNIYAPFRKRKSSPLLTRSQFLRFLRLSRISAFHIYDCLCEQAQINAFEVMAILILASYTTYSYKIQFMFNVFDLLSTRTLKFSDLMLMFKSVVRGFALLTKQPLPDIQLMEKYAQTVFMRADLNNDQNLQLSEILNWVEENKDALALFKAFQPKNYGKQEYHIFNIFSPYRQSEADLLLARIRKVHFNEKVDCQDYQLLRTEDNVLTGGKQNTFGLGKIKEKSIAGTNIELTRTRQPSSQLSKSSGSALFKQQRTSAKGLFEKNANTSNSKLSNSGIFPMVPSARGQSSISNYNSSCLAFNSGQMGSTNKFSNIIIIKGRTITKKDIFDLRDYYEKLSGGKDSILIQDFIESFSQEKYNHMKSVAASLYNFLDQDQNGKVTFKQLLMKIYPNLTPHHLAAIDRWCDQYASSFNLKQRSRPNRRADDNKKRVLPKTCLNRFKQMFSFYDRDRKGFITLEDMQRVLSEVCSQNQINQLFEESDKDCDGKLDMHEFANVILPADLEIEGLQ